MQKSIVIIFIILLSIFLPLHADDLTEEEILNRLSECISNKRIKRQETFFSDPDGISETPKKDFICTKESIHELLYSLKNNPKQDNSYFYSFVLLCTFASSILIYLAYLKQTKQIRRFSEELNSIKNFNSNSLEENYQSETISIKVMNMEARQAGIEDTLDTLLGKLQSSLERTGQYQGKHKDEESNFYMTFPKPDGSFPQASKRKNRESTSYIFFPISESRAEFELSYDKEMLGRILNGHEIYIEPACEPINEVNFRAQQIITLEKGEAFKEGSIWKISKKAKIKYD